MQNVDWTQNKSIQRQEESEDSFLIKFIRKQMLAYQLISDISLFMFNSQKIFKTKQYIFTDHIHLIIVLSIMTFYTKDMLSNDEKNDTLYVSGWDCNNPFDIPELREEDPFWGDGSIFFNQQDSFNRQPKYDDDFYLNPSLDKFVQNANKMFYDESMGYEPSQQYHQPLVKEVESTYIIQQVIDPPQKHTSKSQKNIAGFVTKTSIKLMFNIYSKNMKRQCLKSNISYRDFKHYYLQTFLKKVYGLESLYQEFYTNRQHQEWKKIFMIYFTKVVRQHYTIYALKIGKMQGTIEDYFRIKSQILLYIPVSLGQKIKA